ncbi:homeobox protein Mohawk isoform X3 [Dermochelys coriacea]|uniref:homeobox protein Mohawk isoform X3 n=1 Tax=Dermochelys coriacea TaxID=27794 RepID=UPI0018E71711|nr:homeobox protein Mohawk isoform X3 [Dermochelys coriacea]
MSPWLLLGLSVETNRLSSPALPRAVVGGVPSSAPKEFRFHLRSTQPAQTESSGHPSGKFPTYRSLLQLKNQADCSRPPALPPTMNTVVFNKFNSQVLFEENVKERESNSRPYLGVIDSPQHPEVHIPDSPSIKDNLSLRNRRTGARQSGGKVRHKRQALQDMARPLKQWLYKHRDNPYPTKTEKILLALGSQMTLVQVSNWFANARRRLKNTVRQPDLSWALRIKLYNKYVQGNAERLSVSSDDSCSEDGENPPRNHINEGGYNKPVHHTVIKTENSVIKTGVRPETSANEDYVSPPKYKSSLLNRYLNDSLRHVMATNAAMMEKTRQRNHSGSFSSNEFEEELVSPSSSETEGNFVYRTACFENAGQPM